MSGIEIFLTLTLVLVSLYSTYRGLQRFRDHYNELLADAHRLSIVEDQKDHLERRIFAYETRESIQGDVKLELMDGWRSQGIKDGLLQVMPKMTGTFDAMLKRYDGLYGEHHERLAIASISESNIKILEQNNETLERNYKAQVEASKNLAAKVKTS